MRICTFFYENYYCAVSDIESFTIEYLIKVRSAKSKWVILFTCWTFKLIPKAWNQFNNIKLSFNACLLNGVFHYARLLDNLKISKMGMIICGLRLILVIWDLFLFFCNQSCHCSLTFLLLSKAPLSSLYCSYRKKTSLLSVLFAFYSLCCCSFLPSFQAVLSNNIFHQKIAVVPS